MTQENLPAVPETPVQQARYDRVIAAATQILSAGGQEAVQMKDLAQRAGVSLATLYRYFPSKEYLLLAVSLSRYQAAWRLVSAEEPSGRHGPRAGGRCTSSASSARSSATSG